MGKIAVFTPILADVTGRLTSSMSATYNYNIIALFCHAKNVNVLIKNTRIILFTNTEVFEYRSKYFFHIYLTDNVTEMSWPFLGLLQQVQGLWLVFLRNLSISLRHSLSLTLCLSLVIKVLLFDENFLLNLVLTKFINVSIFLLFFTEAKTVSTSNL